MNPTYQSGFYAPGRGTALHPELWRGCVGAWDGGIVVGEHRGGGVVVVGMSSGGGGWCWRFALAWVVAECGVGGVICRAAVEAWGVRLSLRAVRCVGISIGGGDS